MPYFLDYWLVDGYIHNWLVTAPLSKPLAVVPEDRTAVARSFYDPDAVQSEMPVDRCETKAGTDAVMWHYYRCHDDHLVDVSASYPAWQYLRTWAYAQVKVPLPTTVTFELNTAGPADVWLNGEHVLRVDEVQDELQTTRFSAQLAKENQLLVRFEAVGAQNCTQVFALRLMDFPPEKAKDIGIVIPTKARYPLRQQKMERLFEKAYLEEVVNYRGAHFNLRWAEDLNEELQYAYQIQDDQERIYVEGSWGAVPNEPLDIGHTFRLYERPLYVVLRATAREYYEMDMRYQRRLPLHILDNEYTAEPYSDYYNRQQEALKDAAKHANNLFSAVARMALGAWGEIDQEMILGHVELINRRDTGSVLWLTALLGMLHRFGDKPEFPAALKQPIEDCILGFRYWKDEPGNDAMDFATESQAILFHACEVLAGQRYPERTFTASGQPGAWHRQRGQQQALDWMHQRGVYGFVDWNSNSESNLIIVALTHLTSLVEDEAVADMAAVLLDKLLFLMAINTFHGAYGAANGRTEAGMLKSAQLEGTSGFTRLVYGMGVFNHHIAGVTSLACSDYEFPSFFAEIAAGSEEPQLSRECHTNPAGGEANLVTYRTPDYLLSSVQDYRPGQPGQTEHVWQATMGPEAVVFTTHPACMRDDPARQPGFWLGNAVLPRLAQWKDALVAVYNLPDNAWMDFTHAYFPIYAFDEHVITNHWAFARKGDGYLALTCTQGFEQIKRGPDGYRELRANGRQNIWLCQMGRTAEDGSFDDFRQKVQQSRITWDNLKITYTTLRGEELSFGWEGPLLVDGQAQLLAGAQHIDHPYCHAAMPAEVMDINYQGTILRLNFGK